MYFRKFGKIEKITDFRSKGKKNDEQFYCSAIRASGEREREITNDNIVEEQFTY